MLTDRFAEYQVVESRYTVELVRRHFKILGKFPDAFIRDPAALRLDDGKLSEALLPTLESLWKDEAQLREMQEQMQALAKVDASALLARELLQLRPTTNPPTYVDLTRHVGNDSDSARVHWRRIATGRLTREERGLYRADGTEIWCSLCHAAVMKPEGHPCRVLTIAIDLSPWSWRPPSSPRPSADRLPRT